MAAALSVNVNAIALLRNRRNLPWPSLEELARIALEAGAHGITVHPRPDERHIRRADVPVLASLVRQFPGAEFNIEGNPDARFIELVESVRPDQVTLVPDDVRQATSDHGFDIAAHRSFLTDVIARLRSGGMRVSVFVEPNPNAPARPATSVPTGSRSIPDRMAVPPIPRQGPASSTRSRGPARPPVMRGSVSMPAMT
jgi:pyridoxine 5-phosphate synthase